MSASEDYSASGTDSEEPQRYESGTDTSRSESASEDTETRFMVMKNDANKRSRDDETKDTASKKARPAQPAQVTSPPPPAATDQLKAVNNKTPAAKIAVKKPSEPPGTKKLGQQKQPETKQGEPTKAKEEATPKKTPQAWTNKDEQVLVAHILEDMKTGIRPPKRGARGDNYHYWGDLHEACQGKFIADWSKEQLYDKYRRMKTRFDLMIEKEREEGPALLKFKNSGEEKLFQMWKQIYDMQEQDESEPPPHPLPRSVESKKVASKSPSLVAVAAAAPLAVEEAAKKDSGPSSAKKNKQVAEARQNGKAEGNYTTTNSASNTRSSMAVLQDIQKKSNAQLEEIQGKVNQMMNEFQARSQKLVQEARNAGGRVELLGDWLMMSMSRANSPLLGLEMPSLLNTGLGSGVFGWLGGFWEGSSPAAVKFKEHWLKQQAEELRVMEQRLRLLQELCVHQQEMLKQSQES